jgi:hypothetical protein
MGSAPYHENFIVSLPFILEVKGWVGAIHLCAGCCCLPLTAEEAQAASRGASEAVIKAEAAKQLAEAYVAEAEKWMAAHEVPADAQVPSPATLAAASFLLEHPLPPSSSSASGSALAASGRQDAGGDNTRNSSSGSSMQPVSSSNGSSKAVLQLRGNPEVVTQLAALLHQNWQGVEEVYLQGLGRAFAGLREVRALGLSHVAGCCSQFRAFLRRGHSKQAVLASFLERFNAMDVDLRKTKEGQVSQQTCQQVGCNHVGGDLAGRQLPHGHRQT